MNYLITLLILLMNSCGGAEKKTTTSGKDYQVNNNFYESIFKELESIDTKQYFISFEISDNFEISDVLKSTLVKNNIITESEKNKLNNQYYKIEYNSQLSNKTNEIIELSRKNKANKIELSYIFSKPFQINQNKILILNSVRYNHTISKNTKGGTDRVILFELENNEWKIKQVENLVDI